MVGKEVMPMHGNQQSRKWLLTINNPDEKNITEDTIKNAVESIRSVQYYCYSKEIGINGNTPHFHIFLYSGTSPIRFSRLKKLLPSAHIDKALGTVVENRDYVAKKGKWATTDKAKTNIEFTEYGVVPEENQGKRNDILELYNQIKQGFDDFQLLESNPNNMRLLSAIEKTRQTITRENVKNSFRKLTVTYIFGKTGVGKTRYVMDTFGYDKVFRVTDYKHPFDNYGNQDVICFDEFADGIAIRDMLKYLDGYPLELPCRYANRWAAYTQVFILSNSALDEQYKTEQFDHPELWHALLRRLTTVQQFLPNGQKLSYTITDDYNIIPDNDLETGFGGK